MTEKDDACERLASLKNYLKHTPDNLALLCDAIDTAFSAENLEEAENLIAAAQKTAPDSGEVHGHVGYLHMQKCDFKQAALHYQQAIKLGIDSAVLNYNLAYSYYQLKKYDQALTITRNFNQQSLVDNNLLQPSLLLTARCYYQQYQFSDALATLSSFPDFGEDAEILGLQALLHCDDQNIDDALVFAEKALNLSPDNQEALMAKASCLLLQAHYEEAHRNFERILQLQPKTGRALSGLGQADCYMMNFEDAVSSFQQAVQYLPEQIEAWLMLAWSSINVGNYKEALMALNTAHHMDENHVETHEALATLYALTGEKNHAEKHVKAAQHLDPARASLDVIKALILHQEGQSQDSQNAMEKALSTANVSLDKPLQKMVNRFLKNQIQQNTQTIR